MVLPGSVYGSCKGLISFLGFLGLSFLVAEWTHLTRFWDNTTAIKLKVYTFAGL